eukprot:TRINITY_DN6905_c0_g2_i4.p1 TRINITY_DN6905_c0_g2~~TRINITY_DN6905_c0_g2_i4.p1  ORF type:complete len:207 (-),score=49.58 TRINITY_DN6905_c0_g2_i4:27-587(-)
MCIRDSFVCDLAGKEAKAEERINSFKVLTFAERDVIEEPVLNLSRTMDQQMTIVIFLFFVALVIINTIVYIFVFEVTRLIFDPLKPFVDFAKIVVDSRNTQTYQEVQLPKNPEKEAEGQVQQLILYFSRMVNTLDIKNKSNAKYQRSAPSTYPLNQYNQKFIERTSRISVLDWIPLIDQVAVVSSI